MTALRVLVPRPPAAAREEGPGGALEARVADHARRARGAYAPATERALRQGTAAFAAWCAGARAGSLPAAPATVAAWVDAMAEAGLAPATAANRAWAVGRLHLAAGLPDPTRHEDVRLALRRLRRARGTRRRQAAPLNEAHAAAVLAVTRGGSLAELRDRALLLVARDTLCRRGELVALRLEDVAAAPDGSATVLVRRSKTDPEGQGAAVYLGPEAHAALRSWLAAARLEGDAGGELFRALRGGRRAGGPLGGGDVARILKRAARRAGLDPAGVTGHSPRVGMAQDLAAAGASLAELMTAGRWRSPAMPALYTERQAAARGAVAKYREALGRRG